MKLLTKSAAALQKTVQRQSEIDSGVSIARKVDTLRQTLASLEQQQQIFIEGQKKSIEDATRELFEKKHDLESEIRTLEEHRKELLKPLDDAWNEVRLKQDSLEIERSDLKNEKVIVEEKRHELDTKLNEVQSTLIRIKTNEERALELHNEADIAKKNALLALNKADNHRESVEKYYNEKKLQIELKERKLDYDIKHYKDFMKTLREKERELSLRELKIKSRKN